MNKWTFPHSTCELVSNQSISQPYSFSVNVVIAVLMLFESLKAKTLTTKLTIWTFILFESFHAFSHAKHINTSIQLTTIHLLGYLLALGIFCCFVKYTNRVLLPFWFVLVILLDIYVFLKVGKIYQVVTGFSILVSIVIIYLPHLTDFYEYLVTLVLGVLVIIWMLYRESKNCEKWLIKNPKIPYHLQVEVLGLILFYLLAELLIKLEKK